MRRQSKKTLPPVRGRARTKSAVPARTPATSAPAQKASSRLPAPAQKASSRFPAPAQEAARPRAPAQESESVLYGLRSGLAVFQCRRHDILAVHHAAGLGQELHELSEWARRAGVPIRELKDRELASLAGSNQHEGLVLEVRPRRWLAPKELATWLPARGADALALDRVRNPQNIGAILRGAAFFGVQAAILGAPAPHPGLPSFALRVAEGGAEHLSFSRTTDLADTLARLRAAGVVVIGADGKSGVELAAAPLGRSNVIVFGNEREGLGPRVRAQCDALVGIQGCGAIESLNVAVAAGVLFSELRRLRAAGRGVSAPVPS